MTQIHFIRGNDPDALREKHRSDVSGFSSSGFADAQVDDFLELIHGHFQLFLSDSGVPSSVVNHIPEEVGVYCKNPLHVRHGTGFEVYCTSDMRSVQPGDDPANPPINVIPFFELKGFRCPVTPKELSKRMYRERMLADGLRNNFVALCLDYGENLGNVSRERALRLNIQNRIAPADNKQKDWDPNATIMTCGLSMPDGFGAGLPEPAQAATDVLTSLSYRNAELPKLWEFVEALNHQRYRLQRVVQLDEYDQCIRSVFRSQADQILQSPCFTQAQEGLHVIATQTRNKSEALIVPLAIHKKHDVHITDRDRWSPGMLSFSERLGSKVLKVQCKHIDRKGAVVPPVLEEKIEVMQLIQESKQRRLLRAVPALVKKIDKLKIVIPELGSVELKFKHPEDVLKAAKTKQRDKRKKRRKR